MSKEYPCVYYDREKCTLHGTEPENIDWCVMGPCSKETPSNADHIRSMTDEELAKFLADKIPHGDCYGCQWFYDCFCDSGSCGDNFLNWLKQPYKED